MTKTILKYYVRVVLFLLPLFFLPSMVDAFGMGKNWFFMVSALIGLILTAVDLIAAKREAVKYNQVLWLGLAVAVLSVVSWWGLGAGVKMRSVMSPMGLGTTIAAVAWMFVWMQVASKEEYKKQVDVLTAAGLIAALVSLIVFLFPASKLPLIVPSKSSPWFSVSGAFSLTGSLIAEAVFLVFLVMEWVKRLVGKLVVKGGDDYYAEAGISAFMVLILMLDIFKIIKIGWAALDGTTAWVIAAETFKRSPLLGVGPGNFVQAFQMLRPASFNMTKFWSTTFGMSSMGILQFWTEVGVLGLVAAGILLSMVLKRIRSGYDFWVVLLMTAVVFFLPTNLMFIILFAWLLANKLFEEKKMALVLKTGENGANAAPYILAVVMVVAAGAGLFEAAKIAMAEGYYKASLVAASKNNGNDTYNNQIKAISTNTYYADYRLAYAQTNLALAQSLLSTDKPSDEDKQKASVLIQQAVREGKNAVALDSSNAIYWSNLGNIYKSLIGTVDGAADWSYQAYTQAAALDSVNPMDKMDLGGLLFAAKRYEEADRVFEATVGVKSDYANAWYNWAYTAKNLNRIDLAVARLTQALTLVPADSGDYDKASKELDSWKKELDEAIKKQQADMAAAQAQQQQQKQPETLKTAEPLPTVNPSDKVNVPTDGLQPPQGQVQVTPVPSQGATPTKAKAAPTKTVLKASPTP